MNYLGAKTDVWYFATTNSSASPWTAGTTTYGTNAIAGEDDAMGKAVVYMLRATMKKIPRM